MTRHRRIVARTARRVAATCCAIAGAFAFAACNIDEALEVESPSRIPAGSLESAANAQLLLAGAASDFECAFGTYVVVSGLLGEELEDYLQTAARWPYDRRDVQASQTFYATNSCEGVGIYTPLQTARVSANNIRRLLENWTDADLPAGSNRNLMLATAAAYEAWSMLLLGEAFCTTVFSTFEGTSFNYGDEIARTDAWRLAEERFTQAITTAQPLGAAGSSILNMALVGRARARQNQGNLAGARTDAAQVPANFTFNVTASGTSGRRNNRVYNESNTLGTSASVGPRYRNLNDPRVPVVNRNNANALGVASWAQLKYTTAASSIPLATGDEAQLIVAEADAASNPVNAVAIINAQRAKGNQGPYVGPLTAASLRAEIIEQRRRSLFLQGTHLGDIVRYNLTLTPATGTAFPAGGPYGSQSCAGTDTRFGLPLPDVERMNNPKLAT